MEQEADDNSWHILWTKKVLISKKNISLTSVCQHIGILAFSFNGLTFNFRATGLTGKRNRIELSEKVITSADRLRCTLIHEMCHAATWVFHGEKGHGARWKSYTNRAKRVFPELPPITVCHSYDIQYKYTYKCGMCQSKCVTIKYHNFLIQFTKKKFHLKF